MRPAEDLVGAGEEAAHVAGRLADAVLVFHEADADIALAILTKGDAGGDRDAGLLDQQRSSVTASGAM